MTPRETLIAALAQTLAPKLFEISGDRPEEMGFPIEDSKEAFDIRMERQFSPVEYWTNEATRIATAIVDIIEAGGVSVELFDFEKAVPTIRKNRPDLDAE